ncbi:MAG TPA: flavoprotein [Desulfosporosinus sp.]|nr:flavoprotein [Desulfosporosinus sp.]
MTDGEQQKLIQMVLAELAKQSQSSKPKSVSKKIMAVFSGGMIGLDDVLKQMQMLQREGYQFEAVFTPNGKIVIGKQRLLDSLGSIKVYDDSEDLNKLQQMLQDNEAILVPIMTLNTAAKVINGIADNLATTLIMVSLLSDKPIIAVRDACNLQHLSREGMGHNKAKQAYNAMLASNLERLKDYGIELCEALELTNMVQCKLGKHGMVHSTNIECQQLFEKRILSVADLTTIGSKISISPRTIITPAAQDVIKERGIEIVVR